MPLRSSIMVLMFVSAVGGYGTKVAAALIADVDASIASVADKLIDLLFVQTLQLMPANFKTHTTRTFPCISLAASRALSSVANTQGTPFNTTFINLQSRSDRLEMIQGQLKQAGLQAARLEALTGDMASKNLVGGMWDTTLNSKYAIENLPANISMSPGERGCAASHAALWSDLAKLDDAAAPLLILEDDVILVDEFMTKCKQIVDALHAAIEPTARNMLLYIGGDVVSWGAVESKRRIGFHTVRDVDYVWTTGSYLIWPPGARKLMASLPIDCPVDNFLSKHMLTGTVRGMMVKPDLARQANPYADGDVVHTNVKRPHEEILAMLQSPEVIARLMALREGP